jgi:hypothetical protein
MTVQEMLRTHPSPAAHADVLRGRHPPRCERPRGRWREGAGNYQPVVAELRPCSRHRPELAPRAVFRVGVVADLESASCPAEPKRGTARRSGRVAQRER